jgi:hypothetical protein
MHAHEIYARKMHAHEIYARKMHAHEIYAREMHACEMHACICKMHVYEIYAVVVRIWEVPSVRSSLPECVGTLIFENALIAEWLSDHSDRLCSHRIRPAIPRGRDWGNFVPTNI